MPDTRLTDTRTIYKPLEKKNGQGAPCRRTLEYREEEKKAKPRRFRKQDYRMSLISIIREVYPFFAAP